MKQVRALRAKTTIAFPGSRRFIYQGDLIRSDDPAVKSYPDAFEAVDDILGIEQAVKSPGQKRAAKKPTVDPVVEVSDGVDGQAPADAPSPDS
jgi:hypothetical protein